MTGKRLFSLLGGAPLPILKGDEGSNGFPTLGDHDVFLQIVSTDLARPLVLAGTGIIIR
jgi:hypothetical protein